MDDSRNLAVFLAVVAARFFVPLAIPRYPIPAGVAALVIDGVDQTIFQAFTTRPLAGYQSYDKALDVYYLTIAYLSTLRNWTNLTAFAPLLLPVGRNAAVRTAAGARASAPFSQHL